MHDKNATECLTANGAGCARATEILLAGGLAALPSETVYGLAARADSAGAVDSIYTAKGRPNHNPLIVHVGSLEQARELAYFSERSEIVARETWPGPLTLVLQRKANANIAAGVSADLPTIALRMPSHEVMLGIIRDCGVPLAAPSANASNGISPTTVAHVLSSLDGRIDCIVDDGPTQNGLESTILAIRHDGSWDVLRPGPIDCEALHHKLFGVPIRSGDIKQKVEAPGQLARHYSPGKPVRLHAETAAEHE
ncbi:MAG: L-threonylcarbamoyladenylate synthase, partial [Pontixanthobacter sp.]